MRLVFWTYSFTDCICNACGIAHSRIMRANTRFSLLDLILISHFDARPPGAN